MAAVEHDGRSFCLAALEEALARYGKPEIFNTDQGCQFTSAAFTGALASAAIAISMDGRGRWMDNVFIERLWRSLKYEDVYLKGYADGREAARGIADWIAFYNDRRPHQALADRTPMAVWREAMPAPKAVDMMDNASALPTCPQPTAAEAASRCVIERNQERSGFQLTNQIKRSRCAGPLQQDPCELSPKVGDGGNREGGISWGCLTPPLLHRRSDMPCPTITSSS